MVVMVAISRGMVGQEVAHSNLLILVTCLLTPILELGREPIKSLVETVSAGGARRLDVPCSVTERVESELVRHFSGVHGVGQILKKKKRVRGNLGIRTRTSTSTVNVLPRNRLL